MSYKRVEGITLSLNGHRVTQYAAREARLFQDPHIETHFQVAGILRHP